MQAFLTAALIGASAVLAPPSHAQLPSSASSQQDSPALALAKILVPLDAHVQAEMRLAREGIAMLPEKDKEAAELEKDYPGIHARMWSAMEPELRASLTTEVPKLWKALVGVYEEMLNPTEMAALARFYSTDTGRRMREAVTSGIDAETLVQAAIASNAPLSRDAYDKSMAAGKATAVGSLGEKDRPALEQLVAIMPMAKLRAVGERVQQVTLAWINEKDPALDARIDALLVPAMETFMAEVDARKQR